MEVAWWEYVSLAFFELTPFLCNNAGGGTRRMLLWSLYWVFQNVDSVDNSSSVSFSSKSTSWSPPVKVTFILEPSSSMHCLSRSLICFAVIVMTTTTNSTRIGYFAYYTATTSRKSFNFLIVMVLIACYSCCWYSTCWVVAVYLLFSNKLATSSSPSNRITFAAVLNVTCFFEDLYIEISNWVSFLWTY